MEAAAQPREARLFPFELDGLRFSVPPGKSAPSHYTVHYRWGIPSVVLHCPALGLKVVADTLADALWQARHILRREYSAVWAHTRLGMIKRSSTKPSLTWTASQPPGMTSL